MAKAKAKIVDKWKNKNWYSVIAPKLFNEYTVGLTPSSNPKSIVGRTVKINLFGITHSNRDQNVIIILESERVDDDKIYTKIKKYGVIPSYIKRMVRVGTSRVDYSFLTKTLDNVIVRVKPFAMTRSKVNNSIKSNIRKTIIYYIVKSINKMRYNNFLADVVSRRLQSKISKILNKIYPVRTFEIRSLEVFKGKPKDVLMFENVKGFVNEAEIEKSETKKDNEQSNKQNDKKRENINKTDKEK